MIRRRIAAMALRLVPPDWRDAVERDLDEERIRPDASLQFAVRTAAIGVRLRVARGADQWRDSRSASRLSHARPVHLRFRFSRRSPMRDFGRDIAFAVRGALRRPGYALAVIATLAIGIGANTAIFSIFNWILFRPLPGAARPSELTTIRFQAPTSDGSYFVAYMDYKDLRDAVGKTIAGVAASVPLRVDRATAGDAERLNAEVVTTSYLSLFGVKPVLGRDFVAAEEQPGSPPSVVISRALWRRVFLSDPAAIGRTLTLNGRPFTVVGVTPDGFQGRSMITASDVWMPTGAYITLLPDASKDLVSNRRNTLFGDMFARLRPGATLAQAQAEASAAVANMPQFANRSRGRGGMRSSLGPVLYAGIGSDPYADQKLRLVFRLLMGAVGLLLLLACANAANLLLARATARRREIAVCQAIGASRVRIVRQQLAEGLVLSLAAGLGGLAIAAWLTWLFDGMRIISFLPAVNSVGIDWRVCAFTLAGSFATGVVFAAAPAFISSRVDLQSSLKDGVTVSRGGRLVLRRSLVTVQITVSVLLLIAAGLFVRTLQNIRGLDLGIQPDGLVSFGIQPGRFGMDATRSAAYVRDLLERLRNTPGIDRAAFSWTTSFSQQRSDMPFVRADVPDKEFDAATSTVSPGFFGTMGIPIVAGRDFTEQETREKSDVSGPVILSRRTAAEAFPDGSALGSRLVLSYPKGKVVEVIGIVGDVRGRAVTDAPEGWAYTPAVEPPWGTIHVRSSLPPARVMSVIREAARSLDPVVSPHDVEIFGAAVDRALSEQRLFARVSTIFALVAATLSAIGIYAMMAGTVAERRREFGIRLALGARGRSILALVVRSATVLTLLGLGLGLAGAAAARRLLESRLFGVSSLDPVSIGGAALSILLLTLIASLLPALRAARVDPVRSLRAE